MNRVSLSVAVIVTDLCLVLCASGQTGSDPSTICRWRNNARGAYTLTFDDGTKGQWECAVPVLNQRKLRGTFYVVGSSVEAWWDRSGRLHTREILDMMGEGHEIGSHTYTHPDLLALTETQIKQEMEQSIQCLSRYGVTVTSLAYPFGTCDDRVKVIVGQYVEFARGGRPVVVSSDWTQVDPLNLGLLNGSDHYASLQAASLLGAWAIDVFHTIGEGYLSESDFEQFVDTLVPLRDAHELWVDTLTNIARYIRERRFAQLRSETTNDGSSIRVTLVVNANCPSPLVLLTVQTDISGRYLKAIKQVDCSIGFRISQVGEQRSVIYDMLPNAGPVYIELTNADDAQTTDESGSAGTTSDSISAITMTGCFPHASITDTTTYRR
jgi:peptidoglycan/xylan/chitin deacetylase (PgdA/CDA1 family)